MSNETPNINVFFDNLQVTHVRGPLVEETHYYPFGLTMAGISSKALAFGNPENKAKFNNIEQNSDFDLNMYDAFYRNLDPQIGRFWQIDPKPNEMASSYSAMMNNPIRFSDPLGDTTIYYNASGGELLRTTENVKSLGNVITVIPDDKLKSFNEYVSILSQDGGDLSGSCGVALLRGQGESYDIKGVFDFVDGNAKNYNTQTDIWKPTDGKGPLINEAAAAVEKKNGVWTVNPNKTDDTKGSPFASIKQSSPVSLHTHDNEGRKFSETWNGSTRNGSVESGPKSAGTDLGAAYNKPGTGLLEMAAGKNRYTFIIVQALL